MNIFNKIGLKSPVIILAPMSGVTSYPYRMLNRSYGCEMAFTEMLCARSLSNLNRKTLEMLKTSADDKPLGIQFVAREEKYLLKSMEIAQGYDFDIVDFNAACPMKKIVNVGKSAALLKEPKVLKLLLKAIIANTDKYVTVKIRIGWDNADHAKDIACTAEDAGIDALFVHGRTKAQGYAGTVDYRAIAKIKKALKIPVIASGDIFSAELAKKMIDETGADGVMVARGAMGDPWIFKNIRAVFSGKKPAPLPDSREVARTMRMHLDMYIDFYGEIRGVKMFHKYYNWYTRGFKDVRPLRVKVDGAKRTGDMLALIKEFDGREFAKKEPRIYY